MKILEKGCLKSLEDHMYFAVFMAFSFITFFHVFLVLFYHCTYGCMFCVLLFNSVIYVFLLFMHSYCYVCSVLYILFSSCQLALFGYPD